MILLWLLLLGDSLSPLSAQDARDRADAGALREGVARAEKANPGDLEGWLQIALFEHWMVEVGRLHKDDALAREAAKAGIAAATKAVEVAPQSSEAHRLLGQLRGELIPYVFMGGLRYGGSASRELETALKLDPKSPDAYIGLAIAKLKAPRAFGGDPEKAVELLRTAVSLDPSSDTAEVWLALAYTSAHKRAEALQEITKARALNPNRLFIERTFEELGGR
jgi:Flp pilus assembly protein TadD